MSAGSRKKKSCRPIAISSFSALRLSGRDKRRMAMLLFRVAVRETGSAIGSAPSEFAVVTFLFPMHFVEYRSVEIVTRQTYITSMHSKPEITCEHPVVLRDFDCRAMQSDLAEFHVVGAIGHIKNRTRALIDQQNRNACLPEISEDAKDIMRDQRRQAKGRFAEHQEAGPAPQCASYRQHLALSAGERARLLAATLLETWKPDKASSSPAGMAADPNR
jgi:hypothetical protein